MSKGIKAFIIILVLINILIISACIIDGKKEGDITYRFQERQTATFISALQIGLTSLLGMVIYLLSRAIYQGNTEKLKYSKFWLTSSLGFAFMTIDEYFMCHEGTDFRISEFFGYQREPGLDGLVLLLYGLIALGVIIYYRKEIYSYPYAVFLFCLAAVFFIGMISFDLIGDSKHIAAFEKRKIVVEESFKLISTCLFFSAYIVVFSNVVERVRLISQRNKLR